MFQFKPLTGVVYAITEIPVDLIQSIVDARLAESLRRVSRGQPPASEEELIRPLASAAVREQLAGLRDQAASVSNRTPASEEPPGNGRFDAFAAPAATADAIVPPVSVGSSTRRAKRTSVTVDGKLVDWKAVKRLYLRNRSIKQTAAHFELSPNTVKARVRREGWGA